MSPQIFYTRNQKTIQAVKLLHKWYKKDLDNN